MSETIKLISYNIWHGTFLDPLLSFLEQEQPDILCLQEAGDSGLGQKQENVNLFAVIRDKLKLDGHYEHMLRADIGGGEFRVGVGILSRYPILNTRAFSYERKTTEVLQPATVDRYNIPRVLLGCQLDVATQPLWVFTTHFTISPEAEVTQHQLNSAKSVANVLAEYPEYIFCGDMNTPHGSRVFEILKGSSQDLIGPGHPTLHPTIHPVGDIGLQVDHAFCQSKRIKTVSASVPITAGSDHLPLVIEFSLD